jgi:putative flippase GtrA
MSNFNKIYNNKYIQMLFEHERTGKFARYLFVGGGCAVLDLLLLFLFVNYLHIWYLYAATISFIITLGLSYIGQKYFTFRNYENNHKKQLTIFFVVAIVGLVINVSFMFIFVSWMNLWYMLASVITKFIVFIWNFIANQKLTFKK